MQCPKCRVENREGVKFCEECGTRMERVCPDCGGKAPQRAIRSALAIHWEMARLNEQLLKEGKVIPPLRMRVDFKVVGDTVNLASRMEGPAEPIEVYRVLAPSSMRTRFDVSAERGLTSLMGRQQERINTLSRMVIKAARLRPMVLSIEDFHWMDASSEEAIGYLLEHIPAEQVLLVFTCRPQFAPNWGVKSYCHNLIISRLSDRESVAIASVANRSH